MIAAHEQIMMAVEDALKGITAVSGLAIERDREEEILDSELPFLAVYEGNEAPADVFTGERGYALTVRVEGYVDAEDIAAARSARATLRGAVDNALLTGNPLDGKARDVRLSDEPEPERLPLDAAKPTLFFFRTYVVEYATPDDDAFTLV